LQSKQSEIETRAQELSQKLIDTKLQYEKQLEEKGSFFLIF